MTTFTHVATSSKLLRVVGFTDEAAATAQAAEWESEAPVGAHDAESPAAVYSWAEWVAMADASEVDPMEGIENA